MTMKVLSAETAPEISFPSRSVRRRPQHIGMKRLYVALLLSVSVVTLVGTVLVHYPQKVDAFLNSDEPIESKQVVTRQH